MRHWFLLQENQGMREAGAASAGFLVLIGTVPT
jgi:hypothetical protein